MLSFNYPLITDYERERGRERAIEREIERERERESAQLMVITRTVRAAVLVCMMIVASRHVVHSV